METAKDEEKPPPPALREAERDSMSTGSWEFLCFPERKADCSTFIRNEKAFISSELEEAGASATKLRVSDIKIDASVNIVQPHNSLVVLKTVDKVLPEEGPAWNTEHILEETVRILDQKEEQIMENGSLPDPITESHSMEPAKQPLGFYIDMNSIPDSDASSLQQNSNSPRDKKIFSMFVSLDEKHTDIDYKKIQQQLQRKIKQTPIKVVIEQLQKKIKTQKDLLKTGDIPQSGGNQKFVSLSDICKPSVNSTANIVETESPVENNFLRFDAISTTYDVYSSFSLQSLLSLSRLFPRLCEERFTHTSSRFSFLNNDFMKEQTSCSSEFGNDLLRVFEAEILPDVTLRVQGRHIRAHRIILRSRSPYFTRLLKPEDTSENHNEIVTIEGFPYKLMYSMLQYMYCGASYWPRQINVWDFAHGANFLGLETLKDSLELFLKPMCHDFHEPCPTCISDILDTLPLAMQYQLETIYYDCLNWIAAHFDVTWPTNKFSQLSETLMEGSYKRVVQNITIDNAVSTIAKIKSILDALVLDVKCMNPGIGKVFFKCKQVLNAATKISSKNLYETLSVVLGTLKSSQSCQTQTLWAIHYCINEAIKTLDHQKLTQVYWLMEDVNLFSNEDMEIIEKCKNALLTAINSKAGQRDSHYQVRNRNLSRNLSSHSSSSSYPSGKVSPSSFGSRVSQRLTRSTNLTRQAPVEPPPRAKSDSFPALHQRLCASNKSISSSSSQNTTRNFTGRTNAPVTKVAPTQRLPPKLSLPVDRSIHDTSKTSARITPQQRSSSISNVSNKSPTPSPKMAVKNITTRAGCKSTKPEPIAKTPTSTSKVLQEKKYFDSNKSNKVTEPRIVPQHRSRSTTTNANKTSRQTVAKSWSPGYTQPKAARMPALTHATPKKVQNIPNGQNMSPRSPLPVKAMFISQNGNAKAHRKPSQIPRYIWPSTNNIVESPTSSPTLNRSSTFIIDTKREQTETNNCTN